MTMTDDQVRALLDGATDGPWTVEREGSFDRRTIYGVTEEVVHFAVARAVESRDAQLIAAAPDLARALLQARADAAAAQAAMVERVTEIVRIVWGRCEALEDEAADKLASSEELTDHEIGFWRGQKSVAKSIRRSTEMPTLAPDAGLAALAAHENGERK